MDTDSLSASAIYQLTTTPITDTSVHNEQNVKCWKRKGVGFMLIVLVFNFFTVTGFIANGLSQGNSTSSNKVTLTLSAVVYNNSNANNSNYIFDESLELGSHGSRRTSKIRHASERTFYSSNSGADRIRENSYDNGFYKASEGDVKQSTRGSHILLRSVAKLL